MKIHEILSKSSTSEVRVALEVYIISTSFQCQVPTGRPFTQSYSCLFRPDAPTSKRWRRPIEIDVTRLVSILRLVYIHVF